MTDSLSIHWTFPDGSTRYVGELRTRGIFRSSAASTTSTEMCDCSCRASRTARYLSGDRGVEAVVGAAALSICVHSVDDHPRNMGFLGGKDGWTVAPLFDVVPFPYEERGTPLESGDPDRSLEHLLDLDWGLKKDRGAQIA